MFFTKGQQKLVRELLNLQVVNGKVVGKSPNLADSLAYHVEYWRGQARPEPEEDYEYFDPFLGDIGPDYGLQCVT